MNVVRNILIFTLLVCCGAYGSIVGWMMFNEPQFVYRPSHDLALTPESRNLAYEPVVIKTSDQVTLKGWFVPTPAPRGTVLFLHGNGGNIADILESVEVFHALSYSTLAVDYRGYGASSGTPSEQGLYSDAEAMWLHLTVERGIAARDIVVVGRSLGGGVATWLAHKYPPAALVLEATFTSLPAVSASFYPWLPVQALSRQRFNSLGRIAEIQVPMLIVHSREDGLIPYSHAEQLFAAAQQPKVLLTVQGSHNSNFNLESQHYVKGLASFLHSVKK